MGLWVYMDAIFQPNSGFTAIFYQDQVGLSAIIFRTVEIREGSRRGTLKRLTLPAYMGLQRYARQKRHTIAKSP